MRSSSSCRHGRLKLTDSMRDAAVRAGVSLALHSYLIDAHCDEGRVTAVVAATAGVPRTVAGSVFVDASGDGNLAHLSGGHLRLFGPEFLIDIVLDGKSVAIPTGHVRGVVTRHGS